MLIIAQVKRFAQGNVEISIEAGKPALPRPAYGVFSGITAAILCNLNKTLAEPCRTIADTQTCPGRLSAQRADCNVHGL